MSPPLVPSEDISNAYIDLQPPCSSSSSGITCTHAVNDDDELGSNVDPNEDDDTASSERDMEASDSMMASAWTDSKHSSYLNFMEQNFVRDLYEREYCALDVCGHPSQRHRYVEEAFDPDSAESRSPALFGPMEFKVWENGNWSWRVESKRKMQPWTLLSNPWVKHFRTQASYRSDTSNTTSVPKNEEGEPQTVCSLYHSNIPANCMQGSRGLEVSASVGTRGGHCNQPEAKDCSQRPSVQGGSRSVLKRMAQVESEQASCMRRRAQLSVDEGSMTIGIFGELCKRSDNKGEDHRYYAQSPPPYGDG